MFGSISTLSFGPVRSLVLTVVVGLPMTLLLSSCTSTCSRDSAAPNGTGGTMSTGNNPTVVIETNQGTIEAELYADKAPISVENFLKYTQEGFYDGTVFHRVIDGFMIQGGGFTENMQQKPTRDQIKNEATNGLKNERGTLAMARTNVVDSATAQFFINVKDNDFLNHSSPTPSGYGYAVFGKVTNGMEIVEKIKGVPTTTRGMFQDVPVTPVVIKSVRKK